MAQQTAVEWLQDKLNNVKPTQFCSIETIKQWVEQAKSMEKEQIETAFKDGVYEGVLTDINYLHCDEDAEFYYNSRYNETYNK